MRIVVDASVLIALGRLDLLHLLPTLYDEALVPEEVLAEVVGVRSDAAGAAAVRRALDRRWLTRIAGAGGSDPVAGEDAVIRAAVVHGAIAGIDEIIGRRRARRRGHLA